MSKRKTRKPKKLTSEDKKKKALKKNLRETFKKMGFEYLRTDGISKKFGNQDGDIDSTFVYENLILICEDSLEKNINEHIKKKAHYFEEIQSNKEELISWLREKYQEKFEKFDSYRTQRYKIKFLYIHEKTLSKEKKEQFGPKMKVPIYALDDKDLKYFRKLSSAIKFTAKFELYKFLNLDGREIGMPKGETRNNEIDTAVIFPEENSGFEGVPIISFLMSAEQLMFCSYVLRKDNWEAKIDLYQRLIEPTRVMDIRKFIVTEKKAFINNIIVSLPPETELKEYDEETKTYNKVDPKNIEEIENLKVIIPKKINSIGIIDGQHRIYAHHESNDKYEDEIARIRDKRYLIVTGLLFPKDFQEKKRLKIESEIFLDINDNQKKVSSEVLLHIISLKDPYSPLGIARQVLSLMNKTELFINYFQLDSFTDAKIKIPSLIKYGLKDLVEISDEKETLFKYWNNQEKEILLEENDKRFNEMFGKYLRFCSNTLCIYFSAVKFSFKDDWINEDRDNRFFSVTSITGFVIAFRNSLEKYKIKEDPKFYSEKLKKSTLKFMKNEFEYKSSHWHDFAKRIGEECWK